MIGTLFAPPVVTVPAAPRMWSGEAYPEEMAFMRRATAKRQREFIAGRLCAREALRQLGIHDYPLLPNPDRTPCWPAEIVGSISHCENYCGVAIAHKSEVLGLGLDVERGGPLSAQIVPRVCAPNELQAATTDLPPPPHDWAKIIFSAKEAFYKCYYPLTNTFLEFADVRVTLLPDRRFSARLTRAELPAAAGARELHGRWATTREHVFTGVRR